jgi:hypothetical protein
MGSLRSLNPPANHRRYAASGAGRALIGWDEAGAATLVCSTYGKGSAMCRRRLPVRRLHARRIRVAVPCFHSTVRDLQLTVLFRCRLSGICGPRAGPVPLWRSSVPCMAIIGTPYYDH